MKKLQIFGPGCTRCLKLAENAEAAAKELGLEYELEKVKDIDEFKKYGLMMTPGLAVDGELKFQGQVATVDQIKRLLA